MERGWENFGMATEKSKTRIGSGKKQRRRSPQTSVSLTLRAKEIVRDLRNAYGIKGLYSASLILFNELPPQDREARVIAAKREDEQRLAGERQAKSVVEGAAADAAGHGKSAHHAAEG